MSLVPFITASGTDKYVPEVTQDNYLDAFNQFVQYETIVGAAGTEGGTVVSSGSGGSIVKSSTTIQTVLKSVLASHPLTLTQNASELQLGIDLSDIGTVQDVTAGPGISITGISTVSPTINNDGVISIVPHPDGSIVIDDTDPQNPILQAVVVGSGGGTVTNVSSADTSILTVANPTTTPALTFTGVRRLIQGPGITLSPTLGTTSNARGDVTISTAASGGTVTSVSSANGDIVVSQATPAPVLTFEGVSSITGSGGVTVTSSKVGGRGNVTITASGGGGGGGTVTNVSSADTNILTVANPTTTPTLTFTGVRRLVQGTDILLAPTLGSTSDARGNVTVTAGPNLVRTSTLANYATIAQLNASYPKAVTYANYMNGSSDTTTLSFATNNRWHNIRWTINQGGSLPGQLSNPIPLWTAGTRDFTLVNDSTNKSLFTEFVAAGSGGVALDTNPFFACQRAGVYAVDYTVVLNNPNRNFYPAVALFSTTDSGTNWLCYPFSCVQMRNTDVETFVINHHFTQAFYPANPSGSGSFRFILAAYCRNPDNDQASCRLGSSDPSPAAYSSPGTAIASPNAVRASITFTYLSPVSGF